MKYIIEVAEEYAKKIDDDGLLELCFRNSKREFEKFIKIKPSDDEKAKQLIEEIANKALKVGQKAEKSINHLNHNLNILDKNIDDFSTRMDEFSAKASEVLKNVESSNALGWASIIANSLDLCSSIAGFMIMSEKMDAMTKELGEISKATRDLVDHQELLDQQKVKSLINEYANIQNKKSVGVKVSTDEYYGLVDKMSLTIDTIRECFIRDIGHRKVYLNAISMLLPIYTITMCSFDEAHYFEYGQTHSNRANYIKVLDDFINKDFFVGIQEYCFFDESQKLSTRDSYKTAFAYLEKISEERVLISDNNKTISKFNDKSVYEEFIRRLNIAAKEDILEEAYNSYDPEMVKKVQTLLA